MVKNDSKILIVRSEAENEILANKLIEIGCLPLNLPLLSYEWLGFDQNLIYDNDYLIITSKFVAQSLPVIQADVRIIVVGEESAKILQAKGYDIFMISRNAGEIRSYLIDNPTMQDKEILYLRGNYIAVNMPDYVKTIITYNASYSTELNQDKIALIQQKPDYILLYSANSASTLLNLIIQYKLHEFVQDAKIVALSDRIAAVFDGVIEQQKICHNTDEILNYLRN